MEAASAITGRARELRREFDRAFAIAVNVDAAAVVDLLAIRMGTGNFAVRLSEIAGLFIDKKITPVPGASAALIGIAGFRGAIVPVYDLQNLLGQPGGQTSRWLFVAAKAPVAFAFEAFEGQLRARSDTIRPQQSQAERGFAREVIETGNLLRPIIEIASVLDTIKT